LAALIQTDNPEILPLQLFQGTHQVHHAGDAQVLGCAGACFDGNRAQRGRTALGEYDAVNPSAVGDAQESAEILRVFHAVEGEQQAGNSGPLRQEKVFDGQELLRVNHGHNALVSGVLGKLRQLLAGFLANGDATLAAESDETRQTLVVPLASHQKMVEAPAAGFECLFDRMDAI
jgi:hypothetical protein